VVYARGDVETALQKFRETRELIRARVVPRIRAELGV
jgi:hypothetical protein